ncbi:MAG: tetratricopeptide repeat protein [Isosphaeraceae bacterium]|nr:tetratricopeptide repeat protein [Isosphaeraceae bacterium]
MTVRWKPLLILSGVFITVAVIGLVAITMVMLPRGVEGILAQARASRDAKQFKNAEIFYKQALQHAARDPKFQEELAEFYKAWLPTAGAENETRLRGNFYTALKEAARFGPSLASPRRTLLEEAIRLDDSIDSVFWAKELLTVEPNDAVANYVVAADAVEQTAPNTAEIQRRLDVLEKIRPRTIKNDWIAARLAQIGNRDAELDRITSKIAEEKLAPGASPLDQMALLKLRALDVHRTVDPAKLASKVEALSTLAEAITSGAGIPSSRSARVSLVIEAAQRDLAQVGAASDPAGKATVEKLTDRLETVAEAIFKKAVADERGADLGVYLTYADHLRFRDRRDKCLEVVESAFASPLAAKQGKSEAAQGLHALAVESILGNTKDEQRYEKAASHIKALLEATNKRFQALGHLFQGAIDLEHAGVDSDDAKVTPEAVAQANRLRASAVSHLEIAATELSDLSEAQARYGVALIISREVSLGRQYLQKALRMGNLDIQYLVWAAWSMVQGGYPEDAEPIVAALLADVEAGRRSKDLAGTLHLLKAEIHQARRAPEELKKSIAEYTLAFKHGQPQTPAIHLRLAQIEIMLGRAADALTRIESMTKAGFGSAGAEQLAVLTLQELGRTDDARARLAAARKAHPRSADLAALEASFLVRDGKAAEADRLLAAFLEVDPDDLLVVQTRSQVLVESLNRPEEARALLLKLSEKSESSAPLVQLALIDIQAARFDAAAATIAKVRTRWKNAATSDVLEAQLALARGDSAAAARHFTTALEKDPNNKIVQYWKAQLDGRNDPRGAAKVFENLARGGSVKEIDENLSLATAAQSALANLSLQSGDVDAAISRYQGVLASGAQGGVARGVRWQLVAAHTAKREWERAKAEIASLLTESAEGPSDDERVKAAKYYASEGEPALATAQLERVLAKNPGHPAAVVIRAEMLAGEGKNPEAIALIRKAMASTPDRSKSPVVFTLMLAAIENVTPPTDTGLKRALAVLDQGLEAQPGSVELVQAKARVLTLSDSSAAANAFVESKAKADPKGPWRKILLEQHRDRRDYAAAEKLTIELMAEAPADASLAAQRIRLVAAQAIEAAGKADIQAADGLNLRTATLIKEARTKYPDDSTFVQLESELAARKGEFTKAIALTREVDRLTKNSAVGSLLRAQIYGVQNQTREVAAALEEGLERNPRLPEVRLQLARALMAIEKFEEASRHTRFLLDADPDQPAVVLLHAQALSKGPGSTTQIAERRAQALELLGKAIAKAPNFAEAHHAIADIRLAQGDRAGAVAALEAGLAGRPNDAGGLSLLIRLLAEPRPETGKVDSADLEKARKVVEAATAKDSTGNMQLAASVGFHKTGHLMIALPYAEQASEKLKDNAAAHLNHGDLLLSLAEGERDAAQARGWFEKAVAQYDAVLAKMPTSVEAVNNKAWILHSYLGRSEEALELAAGLTKKVDPAKLPAEFHDTLGTIQLALGRVSDAEESFHHGLRKAPGLPVLNYHMGKLMSATPEKRGRAVAYLEKANAGRDQLTPEMAAELTALMEKVVR